jgi:hypothetical protein
MNERKEAIYGYTAWLRWCVLAIAMTQITYRSVVGLPPWTLTFSKFHENKFVLWRLMYIYPLLSMYEPIMVNMCCMTIWRIWFQSQETYAWLTVYTGNHSRCGPSMERFGCIEMETLAKTNDIYWRLSDVIYYTDIITNIWTGNWGIQHTPWTNMWIKYGENM